MRPATAAALRRAILPLLGSLLAASTATSFAAAPDARQGQRRHQALARALRQHGITRIHTDYWTCHRIAFETRERIVCAVAGEDLRPGNDRYRPFRPIVEADPDAAWAFPFGSPHAAALARALAHACPARPGPALTTVVPGYLVVQPARCDRVAAASADGPTG